MERAVWIILNRNFSLTLDGEIKDGVFSGFGKYYWRSGNLFEGTFMGGKPYNGVLILSDGKMTEIVDGEVR